MGIIKKRHNRLSTLSLLTISSLANCIFDFFSFIFSPSYNWIPMVCLAIALFAGDIGIDPIPYILSAEYFPTKIRTQVRTSSAGQVGVYMRNTNAYK